MAVKLYAARALPARLSIRAAGGAPTITITTPAVDLMGDTIDPRGMDIATYLGGTRAVNFAHDHSRLPVGKTLALTRSAGGIRAAWEWLDLPDVPPVRTAYEAGVLGASVEFVIVEAEPNGEGGVHFAKSI